MKHISAVTKPGWLYRPGGNEPAICW